MFFDVNPTLNTLLNRLVHPQLKVIDPSLQRIEKLLAALGNPHLALPPVVHIAGTNGKGSLLALLRSILRVAGYRVHAYTSPHLVRFNERIVLNHQPITTTQLIPLLERVLALQIQYPATFFEATTAAAFLAFAETPADIILLETGMGGRLDATNVIPAPAVTAITPIGMDHAEFLGNTLTAIAAEKAAIIKPHRPCVIGQQVAEVLPVFSDYAAACHALLSRYGQEWQVAVQADEWHYHGAALSGGYPFPSLQGAHQVENAGTALAVLEQLEGFSVTPAIAAEGLRQAVWPARLQPIMHTYWNELLPAWRITLDGGHNPHAARVIGDWLETQPAPHYLVMGMLRNKDLRGYLAPLCGKIQQLCAVTIPEEAGCYAPEEIAVIASEMGFAASAYPSPEAAITHLGNTQPAGHLLIAGSLYLAGYILIASGDFLA